MKYLEYYQLSGGEKMPKSLIYTTKIKQKYKIFELYHEGVSHINRLNLVDGVKFKWKKSQPMPVPLNIEFVNLNDLSDIDSLYLHIFQELPLDKKTLCIWKLQELGKNEIANKLIESCTSKKILKERLTKNKVLYKNKRKYKEKNQ